ncbi:MAG TPA: archaeosine biosynthesis radical SAM protein RaSEA [Methanotrichaceae archaeon]|nr:archaeosine biosynthesis radical SAM protein RaSEA [Methanotrichaceae archaeon]
MSRAERRLDRPVAVWKSEDILDGKPVSSLTVILRTVGCSWRRCIMCGYAAEGAPATAQDLLVQFDDALGRLSAEDEVVKIYTSGSFLDPNEVPLEARDGILGILQERSIKKLVIESRPEYITPERVSDCLSRIRTEFAIGLETASDLIRQYIIRKGFSFQDFVAASEIVHQEGGLVKAYLLLKPPFLSEGAAIRDALSSAREAARHSDMLSLNLCNIQRGTPLERMWERGEYRPPWLWSAVEVLKGVSTPIICDPVGAGTRRGPHNCGGECDAAIADAIRKHSLTQDIGVFQGLDCDCKLTWQKVVELEEKAFGVPLL